MPEYSTPPAGLRVRRAMSTDFEAIADIHCAALPQDLLPRLGRRALAKVFYPWFLNTELFDFIALAGDDILAGFIVLRNRTPTLREVLPICVKLLPFLVWNCLAHPSVAFVCACYLLSRRHETVEGRAVVCSAQKEIVVVAVAAGWRRNGIGSKLITAAISRMSGSDVMLVKTDSETARSFYLMQGFAVVGHERRCRRSLYMLARPVQLRPAGQV